MVELLKYYVKEKMVLLTTVGPGQPRGFSLRLSGFNISFQSTVNVSSNPQLPTSNRDRIAVQLKKPIKENSFMKNGLSLGLILGLTFSVISCSTTTTSGSNTLIAASHLKMKPVPVIGKTAAGQELHIGGFSGLMFKGEENGNYRFEMITDRGPNGWMIDKERPFLLPDFSPQIVTIKTNLKEGTFEMEKTLPLKKKNGAPLTGLPNIRTEENPVDVFGYMMSLDPDGMDTEALVSDDEGGWWIGEEYAPSLVHFDSNGKMLRRLTPYNELPKIYSERVTNGGFEGIAKEGSKLYGFLQSPIPVDGMSARIVEVDLDSMKTSAEYFYPFEKGFHKIGDAISLGQGKFLVVELNGKGGEKSRKMIYKITLNGSDAPVKKELLIDLGTTAFKDAEKVEGLTLVGNKKIALIKDNDFQIENKTDRKTGLTPFNGEENEMLILEFAQPIL